MTRAERRRAERENKKKATYNFTQEQIDAAIERGVGDRIKKMKIEATNTAVNEAMVLMLGLPMKVLIEKHPEIKVDDFADDVLVEYEKWQDGHLSNEDLTNFLWDYGGIRIETL